MSLPLFLFLLLLSSTTSEIISQRVLQTGFFGTYQPPDDNIAPFFNGWIRPRSQPPRSPIGMIFKSSNGKQALLTQTITSVQLEIYQQNYDDQRTALISIDLTQTKNSYYKWEIGMGIINIQLLQNNTVVNEYACLADVSVQLTPKPNGAAQINIDSHSFNQCAVALSSQSMEFYASKYIFNSFIVMQMVIVFWQLQSCFMLIKWSDTQQVSFARISLMSMTGVLVVTTYRAVLQVSSLTGKNKLYYGILFAGTLLLWIYLFRICRRITSITMFQSSAKRKVYYAGMIGLIVGYAYLMFYFSMELWAQLLVPLTCYIFQSIKNYQLRNTQCKVYYSYYLGIIGTQFLEPLYMYACPKNIYLLEPNVAKALIWSGVFVAGVFFFLTQSIILAVQFKFFFKPPPPEQDVRRSVIRRYQPMPVPGVQFQPVVPGAQFHYQQAGRQNLVRYILNVGINRNTAQRMDRNLQNDHNPAAEIPQCSICCFRIDKIEDDDPPVVNTSEHEDFMNGRNQVADPVRTGCGHYYHGKCLQDWMKRSRSCPLCRGQIDRMDRVIF